MRSYDPPRWVGADFSFQLEKGAVLAPCRWPVLLLLLFLSTTPDSLLQKMARQSTRRKSTADHWKGGRKSNQPLIDCGEGEKEGVCHVGVKIWCHCRLGEG
jgi:hypothetical protein